MTPLEAIALGMLQGLTEFLPVSSSGHLVLAQSLLGIKEPQLFFDVAVHVGTLLAVFVFYWKDLAALIKCLPSLATKPDFKTNQEHNLIVMLLITTIITGTIGFAFKDFFEELFSSPKLVSGMLIVTGLILSTSLLVKGTGEKQPVKFYQAITLGFTQAIAIIPGISRSGTTISSALLIGFERENAAKYSFLAMIPAVFGAALLILRHLSQLDSNALIVSCIGLFVSAGTGYLALKILVSVVKRGKFYYFAPYCVIVGCLGILFA